MRKAPPNIGSWARALGLVAVAAAIVAAGIHFRHGEPEAIAPANPGAAPTQTDPLAEELARCRTSGMGEKIDAACEAAWAENRRRFFTDGAPNDHATAPTPTSEGR